MHQPSTRKTLLACAMALAVSASPAAQAATAVVGREIEIYNGGIGRDEAELMREQASSFPLEIQFARRMDLGDAFAADVRVVVTDVWGNVTMEIPSADPILLVTLPPGRYTIEATYEGQTKRQTVDVGRRHTKVGFAW